MENMEIWIIIYKSLEKSWKQVDTDKKHLNVILSSYWGSLV